MSETITFDTSPAAQTSVALTVIITIGFGLYVVWYYRKYHTERITNEEFVAAKKSTGKWTIALSFYASGIGSWVITAPADLTFYTGLSSVFGYAIAVGFPPLVIAYLSPTIQKLYPKILSLSDFINWRFGRLTQIMVVVNSLVNMAIAATAEYTGIISLFSVFVGLGDLSLIIAILIAVVTLSYTTYGGLKVSILTDRYQAAASISLVIIVVIYILATLKELPTGADLTTATEDELLGNNEGGYATMFTLPLSLLCATVYSEAFWQRAWASESTYAVKFGAWGAFVGLFTITFVFGLIGIYGRWSGLTDFGTDPNLRVFAVLDGEDGAQVVTTAMGVLTLILAVIMSESAIDSLQNGIGASVNGVVSRFSASTTDERALLISRIIIVLLNIPMIIVATQRIAVLQLFLVSNMITTSSTVPIVLGAFDIDFLRKYHVDYVGPMSFLITFLITSRFGQVVVSEFNPQATFADGIAYSFWENTFFDWPPFLVAILSSFISCFLLIALNFVVFRFLPDSVLSVVQKNPDMDEVKDEVKDEVAVKSEI